MLPVHPRHRMLVAAGITVVLLQRFGVADNAFVCPSAFMVHREAMGKVRGLPFGSAVAFRAVLGRLQMLAREFMAVDAGFAG